MTWSEDLAQPITGSNGQPGVIAHTLTAEGFDASEDGTGRGTPLVPYTVVPIQTRNATRTAEVDTAGLGIGEEGDPCSALGTSGTPAVATYRKSTRAASAEHDETWVEDTVTNTLNTHDTGDTRAVDVVVEPTLSVRRLTPMECERLQGFPDGWTELDDQGKPFADGPRYRFMGNAVAVPCGFWVIDRIAGVIAREARQ